MQTFKVPVRICGLLKYNCLKCSSEVLLEVHSNMQEVTLDLWRSMFNNKLCFNCHSSVSTVKKNMLLN